MRLPNHEDKLAFTGHVRGKPPETVTLGFQEIGETGKPVSPKLANISRDYLVREITSCMLYGETGGSIARQWDTRGNLWACDAMPQATRFPYPKRRKPREPENAKARKRRKPEIRASSSLTNCRCPSRRTPCMGGSAFFRMRKNLRCATRKIRKRKSRKSCFYEQRSARVKKTGYHESGKTGKRETDKEE